MVDELSAPTTAKEQKEVADSRNEVLPQDAIPSADSTLPPEVNISRKRPLECEDFGKTFVKELRTKSPEPRTENSLPKEPAVSTVDSVEKVAEGASNELLNLDQAIALEAAVLNESLEEEIEDDEDVAAVLGDCSDTECSYKEGYKKRQALYSCLTCYEKSKEVAGICLACTYSCHDGHTFVEMYTKRNFRCDCGNSKFSGLACKLIPDKDILNDKNQYNQNFHNIYCICRRPHPDPEREELIQAQCEMCEDWFHLEHVLKMSKAEIDDHLDETRSLICQACRKAHPFVNYYIAEEGDADFEFDKETHRIDGCALEFLKNKFPVLPEIDEAGWTLMDWHENICRCEKCLDMYKEEKVDFFLDPEDSFFHYSEKGIIKAVENKEHQEEAAMQEIVASLGRYGQIEFAASFAEMRNNLRDMITEVHSRGGVITTEVIQEFFQKETEKLKKKREALLRGTSDYGSGSNGSS